MEVGTVKELTYGKRLCGVPQCTTYKHSGVSMHNIPKEVLNSKELKKKWMIALKMGKDFPKNFRICSNHFKKDALLIPAVKRYGIQKGIRLKTTAFPTENLPISSFFSPKEENKSRAQRLEKRNITSNSTSGGHYLDPETEFGAELEVHYVSTAVQCEPVVANKQTQAHLSAPVYTTSLWDTDGKLFTKTGI